MTRESRIIRAYYENMLEPSTYDWALQHGDGGHIPSAEWAARTLAPHLADLGTLIPRYRKVWFLGRDADVLFAYYYLRHSNVAYLPAMSRELIWTREDEMARYVRALVGRRDLVVDTGFKGTVPRFVADHTGADWIVLVGNEDCTNYVVQFGERSVDLRKTVVRAVISIEYMPMQPPIDEMPVVEARANVADIDEVDAGIFMPYEYWILSRVKHHANFVRTFIDTLYRR